MLRLFTAIVCLLGAASCAAPLSRSPSAAAAATPGLVLNHLYGNAGKGTLTGQHNREPTNDPTLWTRKVRELTGEYPALWGGDLLFHTLGDRPLTIAEAKRQWQAGSLVTLTWHMCPPTVPEPCAWGSGGVQADLTDAQWTELITPGTPLHTAFLGDLDAAVPHLRDLQTAGVEVLWRPLHEMNDAWAWWGGRPGLDGSRRLYQIMYDYLAGTQDLTNLVWVWNVKDVAVDGIAAYYPGDDYVDVASIDIWMKDYPSTADYNAMVAVAGGKPIALGEVAKIPTDAVLAAQPRWAWFMVWAEYVTQRNTAAEVRAAYTSDRTLTRAELRRAVPAPLGADLAAGRPVWAASTEDAHLGARWAVDGDNCTRWSSGYADSQWIYVDLGAAQRIGFVRLDWEAAYAAKYQIQVSLDGTTWTTVFTDEAGNGGVDDVALTPVTARYVKMYAWVRGTPYGYSLWQFEAYTPTA